MCLGWTFFLFSERAGSSLGIRDWRILRLLPWILPLRFLSYPMTIYYSAWNLFLNIFLWRYTFFLLPEFLWPNSLYCTAHLQTSNGFSCSINHLSAGGVNANHNRQRIRPAWPVKTKLRMNLDGSRIAKEIAMMSGLFVEGRRQTLLCSCKSLVRIRNIRKIFEEN